MAVTTQRPVLPAALFIVRDTDADNTSENDVKSGAATVFAVQINNALNASATSYLKMYNAAAPTVGTTAPDMVLFAVGGATTNYAFPKGIAFGTGLSYACVTTAGTAGTTAPTSAVTVIMVIGS